MNMTTLTAFVRSSCPRRIGSDRWKKRDPVVIYRERLRQFGVSDDVIARIDADVRRVVDEATEKCKAAPPPPLEILTKDVYADGGWAWRN